jgi:ATP-dependent exoDNAse (exonuclease V) alpha subunit
MAIYHLSMKPMSRSSGRSAVAAIAYRAAEKLTNERDGIEHDFTRRQGVEHAEIVLPEGIAAGADWARERAALWNAAERAEVRRDARVAREIEVALPHELTAEQRLELTREFSRSLADRYGVAVDFAIHSPHGHTDIRNHHAHIMLTTRKVGEWGLSEKSELELENKKLPGSSGAIRIWRARVWIFGSITAATRSAGWSWSRPSIWAFTPRRWNAGTSWCRGCGSTRTRRAAMPRSSGRSPSRC